MNKPLVTVITVCYNAVETIEKTIVSVLSQSYPNIEYIIVDGASTDGTIDVIKKYEDQLTAFISEPDNGVYDAMNKGLKCSNGKWVSFMNSGDYFVNEKVVENVFIDKISADVKVLYGDVVRYFPNQGYVPQLCNSFQDEGIQYNLNHQSTFIDGNIMRGLKYNLKYRIAADADFFNKVKERNGKFQYVPVSIAVYEAATGLSSKLLIDCYMELTDIKQINKCSIQWLIGYLKILLQVFLMRILPTTIYNRLLYKYVRRLNCKPGLNN